MGDVDQARLETAARRFRLALDLFATGEALMRQRLRREYPDLPDGEIEARLLAWLQTRPGAEFGDAAGILAAGPRRQP
jgi:hypothetical protein